jgi:RHS repeat-associated protein
LSAVSGPSSATYAYNGLGDRYQQTVGSQTTTYVLDLNAGLTQILDDGDSTYLYGLGRIAQINASTDYFMGDALGSVRQLVDGGDIVLAKSYAPYGEDLYSTGSGESAFAYTGEQTDPNGLIYLRARYYGPSDGRFLSRDTWDGEVNSPMSFNRWGYVEANPVNYADPSGNFSVPCYPAASPGKCLVWVWTEIVPGILMLWPQWVECDTKTPAQITNTPAPGTPTPGQVTSTPQATPTQELHIITVKKGLKETNPGEFKNFANPNPVQFEPGGYSAYEYLTPGLYKYELPFTITYKGERRSGTRGTVTGVQLKSGKVYFNAGVAVYSPELEDPAVGTGHWSIFVVEKAMSEEEFASLRSALSTYAKDFFGKLKPTGN